MKHDVTRQPVTQAAQAQATSYTSSPSTGNQLYGQRKHRPPVIQAAQAQATSYNSYILEDLAKNLRRTCHSDYCRAHSTHLQTARVSTYRASSDQYCRGYRKCARIPMCSYSNGLEFQCGRIPMWSYSNVVVFQCARIPMRS